MVKTTIPHGIRIDLSDGRLNQEHYITLNRILTNAIVILPEDYDKEVRVELWRYDDNGDEFLAGGWIDLSKAKPPATAEIMLLNTEGEKTFTLQAKLTTPTKQEYQIHVESKSQDDDDDKASYSSEHSKGSSLHSKHSSNSTDEHDHNQFTLTIQNLVETIEIGSLTQCKHAISKLARYASISTGIQTRMMNCFGVTGLRTIIWQLERHDPELSKAVHRLLCSLTRFSPNHIVRIARACDWPGVLRENKFYYYIPHAVLREAFTETHTGVLSEEAYAEFAEEFVKENSADIGVPSLAVESEAIFEALRTEMNEKKLSLGYRLVKLFALYNNLCTAGVSPEAIAEDPFVQVQVSLPPGTCIKRWSDLRERYLFQYFKLQNTTAESLKENITLLQDFIMGIHGQPAKITIINIRRKSRSRIHIRALVGEEERKFRASIDLPNNQDALRLTDEELAQVAYRCDIASNQNNQTILQDSHDIKESANHNDAPIMLQPIETEAGNRFQQNKKKLKSEKACLLGELANIMPQVAECWNKGSREAAGKLLVQGCLPMITHLAMQPGLRADVADAVRRVKLSPQNPREIYELWQLCEDLTEDQSPATRLTSSMSLVAELWNSNKRVEAGTLLVAKSTPLLKHLPSQTNLRKNLANSLKRVRLKPQNERAIMALWRVCEEINRELNLRQLQHPQNGDSTSHSSRKLSCDIARHNRLTRETIFEETRKTKDQAFENSLAKQRARQTAIEESRARLRHEREQDAYHKSLEKTKEAERLARYEAEWYREEMRLREVEAKMRAKEVREDLKRRAAAKAHNDKVMEEQRKRVQKANREAFLEQERRKEEYESRAHARENRLRYKEQQSRKSKDRKPIPEHLSYESKQRARPPIGKCHTCHPPYIKPTEQNQNLYATVDWENVCDWPELPDFQYIEDSAIDIAARGMLSKKKTTPVRRHKKK